MVPYESVPQNDNLLTLCAATRFKAFSLTLEALLANIFDSDLMTNEMYDNPKNIHTNTTIR